MKRLKISVKTSIYLGRHAVGEGAPWIAEPVPDKFGTPSH
jgi:hypothetical protein